MMSALANFHFLRPWALLALAALPLLWLAVRRSASDAGGWRAAVDAHLLPHLIERSDGKASRAPRMLAAFGWIIACIALAGPAWERESMPLLRNEAARVFALELSPTMLAQDVKPSRLDRARFKLDDLLARSRDYQTALIGYAGEAFVAAPLTDDAGTVRHLVESLDPSTMPVPGNTTGRAIDKAVALIEQAGLHRGQIVLIADAADGNALAAAKRAHAKGFDVSVLGVGTAAGAPVALAQGDFLKDSGGNVVLARLDESALRELASAGGGRYSTLAADRGDLDALLPDDARVDAAKSAEADDEAFGSRWRDRGPWLLLVLAPIALLGFRRGWLMVVTFALVAPPQLARAASFSDLWQRRDQQAAAALARGDTKHAAAVAPNAAWSAGAAYRDGDYAKAADGYAHVDGADGAYNRGNALAQLGRYEEAIAAYDDALKHAPGMGDAVANRKIVEDALKRQKEQQKNQQGQKNQNSDSAKKQDDQQKSGEGGDSQKQDQDSKQQNGDASKQADDKQGSKDSQQQDKHFPSQSQDGQSQDAQKNDASAADEQRPSSQDGEAKSQQQGDDKQTASPSPQDAQQAQANAQQREALSQSVDQALAKDGKQGDKDEERKTKVAVPAEDASTREKRQALDQWLQRVPDDPGGLLRRKFMLEYQRRQQGGGDGR